MPKNKFGGKSHRKMANKNVYDGERTAIRLSKEEDEKYAIVTKMFGNGMADVLCQDRVTRLLQIRKKFRGRNKRDNTISLNSIILVGIRSWEVVSEKKRQKADLLYVYAPNQYESLRNIPEIYNILPENDSFKEGECGFVFSNKPTWMIKKEEEEAEAILKELEDAENKKKAEEKDASENIVQANEHLDKTEFAWDLDEDEDDFDIDDI